MKLLVYEYITGGGLAGQAIPVTLAAEGRMMLQALLNDLQDLPGLQLLLPLDQRCGLKAPSETRILPIRHAGEIQQQLPDLINQADCVWPIAPESRGLLTAMARQVKHLQKTCLLSVPDTVALCSDKLATCQKLRQHAIPVVETFALELITQPPYVSSVIKPRDAEGCDGSQIITSPAQWASIRQKLDNTRGYIVQPLLGGQALSLSALFKHGQSWLLSCNQQHMAIKNQQFQLQACSVNVHQGSRQRYQKLLDQVAMALPGLWGYIGIDLIETAAHGLQILEINPRLTTSYAGIRQATGVNVAEQVLALLQGEPCIKLTRNQTVKVVIQ